MAVSRDPGHTDSSNVFPSLFDGLSRHDLTLVLLPLGFVFALLAHAVASIPMQTAIAAGAAFSLLVMIDALFVNPPSENPPRSSP